MNKVLLLVGAGVEVIPGIRRAHELGLHVIVSDGSNQAPGIAAADDFLYASTYDVEATVAAARNYHQNIRPIDGVMAIATDVPVTVAHVAAELVLPGIPLGAAELAADKLAMKERFVADDVPIPWFSSINSEAALRQVVAVQGLPLVVKPVDSRGARGVTLLDKMVDLAWAYGHARRQSPTGRVMVERYLDGPQVSTESIMLDGIAYTPGFSDRNYEYLQRFAPHMIENGGELPSHLDAGTQERVCELVQQAALSMGVHHGVVKGDIVVHEGTPHVIELAARLSGGYFCSHEIPLNTGVDFVGHAMLLGLGESISPDKLHPVKQQAVAQRYLFPPEGVVKFIQVADWIGRDRDIALFELRLKPGDRVGPIHSHPARGGVVIATGAGREAAIAKANAAIESIMIEMDKP